MNDRMEFPEDVLTIIRAYTKPLLRFSGEFRLILIELGLRDWPEVRAKLCSPIAEQVIVALRAYKNVYLEAAYLWNYMNRPMYPRILPSSRTEYVNCIKLRNRLYRDLDTLLERPVYQNGIEDERFYRHFQHTVAQT